MINEEEIHAVQLDLFDNRNTNNEHRSDLVLRLRFETPNTDGQWYHATGQLTEGRKPSQTRRGIADKLDLEIFEHFVGLREELQIANTIGWDFKPVITSFYPKGEKKSGRIPTFYAIALKKQDRPWEVILQLGHFAKHYKLEDKDSQTHKIYYVSERYVYKDIQNARQRYGF